MWDFSNLLIANAGTTSSKRVRGFFENSYNIITVENKKIQVDLKVVGGKRTPFKISQKIMLDLKMNKFSDDLHLITFPSYTN